MKMCTRCPKNQTQVNGYITVNIIANHLNFTERNVNLYNDKQYTKKLVNQLNGSVLFGLIKNSFFVEGLVYIRCSFFKCRADTSLSKFWCTYKSASVYASV